MPATTRCHELVAPGQATTIVWILPVGAAPQSATPMSKLVSDYLDRPMTSPARETLAAFAAGPMPANGVLGFEQLDRLLDPTPLERETGWCVTSSGVVYVAVLTPMPRVTGEMVDWWFDWHQRESVRYQVWYPAAAHAAVSFDPPAEGRAKRQWGATHYPVEDIGLGMSTVRIDFVSPTEIGFSSDALDHPNVATIVCGWTADKTKRMQAGPMITCSCARETASRCEADSGSAPRSARTPLSRSPRRPAEQPDREAARVASRDRARARQPLRGGVREPRDAPPRAAPRVRRHRSHRSAR